ncbi:MAG: endonuclease domain-containing protein [Phycisphaerales bacterium JB039]
MRPTEASSTRALELRKRQTPPEGILWSELRNRQVAGLKFRRQCPLGDYIADFYCHEAALIVEVDGLRHSFQGREQDERRDAWMRERGIETLRVSVSSITKDVKSVVSQIRNVAVKRRDALLAARAESEPVRRKRALKKK